MHSHETPFAHHEHAGPGHPLHGHAHGVGPIDSSYHLVVRTVLWIIAGLVFLGFAVWWIWS